LLDHCPLKIFLRKHTADEFGKPRLVAAPESPCTTLGGDAESLGMGSPPAVSHLSDDDIAAELGEEFMELFHRLPH